MNRFDDGDPRERDDIREMIHRALDEEPALGLEPEAILSLARRRLRMRRYAGIGGVAAAVAGVALGASLLGGPVGAPDLVGPASPPETSRVPTTPSVTPGPLSETTAPVPLSTTSKIAPPVPSTVVTRQPGPRSLPVTSDRTTPRVAPSAASSTAPSTTTR